MASAAILSTLEHITEVKLGRLARKQASFEEVKKSALETASAEQQKVAKVRVLLAAFKTVCGGNLPLEYANIEKLLLWVQHDTSISVAVLDEWQQRLEHKLAQQEQKFNYTALFGRLVTEWIKNPNQASGKNLSSKDEDLESTLTSRSDSVDSAFENVGREEMHEQRREWESYAFGTRTTDPVIIEKYLESLFSSTFKSKKLEKSPIENLREKMARFDRDGLQRFDERVIRMSIDNLLRADLFAGEKRRALQDLKKEKAVLIEMADVLNADLDALDVWQWEPLPLRLNMRKQISGKYRVYMDEELHQAIFIQWIGTLWAVFLKQGFVTFFHSGAWLQTGFQSLSKMDMRRREHFLGPGGTERKDSIQSERRRTFAKDYFMTQLPSKIVETTRDYGQDEEDEDDEDEVKSPLAIKQSLLTLVVTESLINTHVHGDFTVLQSDFKWFGPSLPHGTIFSVLKYFNVDEKWLKFFKTFLQTPLAFAQDGADAISQIRTCGIPISHILADALGEAVLFVLDFAVNQRTKGSNLYRFHDDLWFWGRPETCSTAWKAMLEFSQIMGLDLNDEKTGVCHMVANSKSPSVPKDLPKGDVRWGFLKMTSVAGHLLIDEEEIKKHTQELKRQLSASRSILAYVQAYNAYMGRFFVNNLSRSRMCLGRKHLDLVITTIGNIQKDIFGANEESDRSVADHLKQVIANGFNFYNVPDGFIFFPPQLGGLGVVDPLIAMFSKYDGFKDPAEIIQAAYESEEHEYEEAKRKYEKGLVQMIHSQIISDDEPFMSFEEFMRFREERSSVLLTDAYRVLLEEIQEPHFDSTPAIRQAARDAEYNTNLPNEWWTLELYGRDVMNRFGSLSIGEKEFLPAQMLEFLKSEKVRWQG